MKAHSLGFGLLMGAVLGSSLGDTGTVARKRKRQRHRTPSEYNRTREKARRCKQTLQSYYRQSVRAANPFISTRELLRVSRAALAT